MNENSEFLRHEACPACGSSDGLARLSTQKQTSNSVKEMSTSPFSFLPEH